MIRNIFRLLFVCCIAAFSVGCAPDELVPIDEVENIPDGYISISGEVEIPQMQEISTRASDPDGYGVQNMTLFCFGPYGLFLTTSRATITPTPPAEGEYASTSGTFKASVPARTDRIHFVCNQNITDFREDENRNHTEEMVLAALEGSSGRVIYWARFAKPAPDPNDKNSDEKTIAYYLNEANAAGKKITLIRNQSRVRVDDSATGSDGAQFFKSSGFEVANVYAFGTIAPFHRDYGFPTAEAWQSNSLWANHITLPTNKEKLSDLIDVKQSTNIFIYEHPNTEEDPVSVIIRGRNAGDTEDLYYRIMLLGEDGAPVPIRRNTIYTIHTKGKLSFGQPTFQDALNAPATNNVWLSIDEDIRSVEDKNFILSVDRTSYIYSYTTQQNNTFSLPFTLEAKTGTLTQDDKPEVSWMEGQTVASTMNVEFEIDQTNDKIGKGKVNVTLNFPFGEEREGTILIKKGKLWRKIKVITVKKMTFDPSWVSTQILGDATDKADVNSHVSLKFTIPETCPAELFPLKVYVVAPDLDVRNDDKQLPMIFNDDPDYGQIHDGDVGYKYVYTAEAPGEQRIYFYSKLPQTNGSVGLIHLESEHFEEMIKDYQYTSYNRIITVKNMRPFPDPEYNVKDAIPYYFVPQKKNAFVQFDVNLQIDSTGTGYEPVDATNQAVFKIFTDNMTPMTDDDPYFELDTTIPVSERDVWYFPCDPAALDENGKFWWFWQRPRRDEESHEDYHKGNYTMFLRTNKSRSAETVRIVSLDQGEASPRDLPDGNWTGSGQFYPGLERDGYGWGGIGNCGYYGQPASGDTPGNRGVSYRSMIFELANYRPFRFYPQVYYGTNEDGSDKSYYDEPVIIEPSIKGWGAWPEEIVTQMTDVQYGPGQRMDIEFDITSFGSVAGESVDPFGLEFDVYIDAPMLSIDNGRLASYNLDPSKLRPDPSVPGRFIYTVDADRLEESRFGCKRAMQTDDIGERLSTIVELRGKERKHLPFVTSKAVSAGDIVISSEDSIVVYMPKTFRISNPSIVGNLSYKHQNAAGIEVEESIPQGAFVTFERVRDANRVGAIVMTADGQYELRLRKEFDVNWYTDRMEFGYTIDGVDYVASVPSLSYLFDNRDFVLDKAGPVQIN